MDNIDGIITKIYKKNQTFVGRYGYDLLIALIIVYIFLIGMTYFYVLNNLYQLFPC